MAHKQWRQLSAETSCVHKHQKIKKERNRELIWEWMQAVEACGRVEETADGTYGCAESSSRKFIDGTAIASLERNASPRDEAHLECLPNGGKFSKNS